MTVTANCGFHVYATGDHFPILDQCVASVLSFSKYPIKVYSINCDYSHKDSRVTSSKIVLRRNTFFDITKVKIIAAYESSYDISMSLDADMLVTPDIDHLLESNVKELESSKYPLFSRHPTNPFISNNALLKMIHDRYKVLPTMGYVFAHFLHGHNHKWFFNEVRDAMDSVVDPSGWQHDEYMINAVLAKYAVTDDIGYNFMPNGTDAMFRDYLNGTISDELKTVYLMRHTKVKFYSFHGHNCKNPTIMREWINIMKTKGKSLGNI